MKILIIYNFFIFEIIYNSHKIIIHCRLYHKSTIYKKSYDIFFTFQKNIRNALNIHLETILYLVYQNVKAQIFSYFV